VALSVDELIEPMTTDQVLTLLLDILRAHGFPVASWQSGSIQLTLLQAFAELASEHLLVANYLLRAGLLPLSTGGWLTLLSDSHYDNQRFDAVKTKGGVVLTDAESTGPHTISVDEIVLSDAEGRRFRNTTGGTLSLGLTLALTFEAELAGADGNVADDTITVVIEGPPGVTATNPDTGDGWITTEGADEESDSSLQERDRTKWAGLGINGPAEAYVNWAREADSAVTRVYVDDTNPRGAGTLDVYLAGAGGPVAGSVVTAVTNYIEGTADQVGRKAIGADLLVQSATQVAVDFSGTVYVDPSLDLTEMETAVQEAIEAFLLEVPIGGVKSFDDEEGQLLLGKLYHAIFSIPGVVNLVLTAPITNITLQKNEVAVLGTPAIDAQPAAF